MPTMAQARTWYEGVDAIHDFSHIQRVYHMAERLTKIEGADLEIVHAAALLHDSRGTMPGSGERAEHHLASAVFAQEVLAAEGWPQDRIAAVQHCIRAHRFRDKRERPETIEAKVLFDADKLDVLGAVGVMRTLGYALLAGEPPYVEPSQHFLDTGEKEPGEPHSAYHEYLFKLCKIKDVLFTDAAREVAKERDAYLADFFRRYAAESRGEM